KGCGRGEEEMEGAAFGEIFFLSLGPPRQYGGTWGGQYPPPYWRGQSPCAALDVDFLRHSASTPAGNEHRMAPLAASDEHQNVVWRAHDGRERLLVRAVYPAWPVILFVLGTVHAVVFQLP